MGFFDKCFCCSCLTEKQSVKICTWLLVGNPKHSKLLKIALGIITIIQILDLSYYIVKIINHSIEESFDQIELLFIIWFCALAFIISTLLVDYWISSCYYINSLVRTHELEDSTRKKENGI
ncbi:hypothetical protein BCR36DRAFT_373567 [Piromyces finnis]|uniref:Uncharacterized protein n=1 Tax=Piromyces finnis TaxID=1754191 RepID=A0A1Y1UZ87_9FUNG|nr:hypothetical protein BCR36DRAFT_373567 [Piromyces finnis]|eukprot:ORX43914.1 hypothetical protein BCR36DRAFT_373567 [Piromyces finnis]